MPIPIEHHGMIPVRILAEIVPLYGKQIILGPKSVPAGIDFELAISLPQAQQIVGGQPHMEK